MKKMFFLLAAATSFTTYAFTTKETPLNPEGLERLKATLGGDVESAVKYVDSISPDFVRYIVNFGYTDLYARSGLSERDRQLVAVSSLISQGNTGLSLKSHINGMLNAGWSQEEVIEVIILLIGYLGFPTTLNALFTAQEVFENRKDITIAEPACQS